MERQRSILYYGWIIVGVAFVSNVIAYALRYSFSIFYVAILEDFGWTREACALAFSINLIVYAMSAPVVGGLVDRFGIRRVVPCGAIFLGLALAGCSRINGIGQLYVVIALTAFGSCAVGFVPHLSVIPNWFLRKRGLAIGIVNTGILASSLLAPVVQGLIDRFGWRGAFLVFAGFTAIILAPIAGIFHRQRPEEKGLEVDGLAEGNILKEKAMPGELFYEKRSPAKALTSAARTRSFWGLIGMCLFLGFYLYTLLVHQVAYLNDAGYSKDFAAQVVALFGVFSIVGSLCAFISDQLGRELTFSLSSAVAMFGVIVFMIIRDTAVPWVPYTYAVAFGLPFGMTTSIMGATAADLFHGRNFGVINGVAMGGFVVGGAVGPWLAGLVFDVTGSYAGIFPLIYFAMVASMACIWIAAPGKARQRTTKGSL